MCRHLPEPLAPFPSPPPQWPESPYPKDISLPFDLRGGRHIFWKEENLDFLSKEVFPGVRGLSFDHGIVRFHLSTPPPKPWPRTIGGVPCYLSDQRDDFSPLTRFMSCSGRNRIKVLNEIDARGQRDGTFSRVFEQNVDKVFACFEEVGLDVVQVLYMNHFIALVLRGENEETDREWEKLVTIPRVVMGMLCGLSWESETGRLDEAEGQDVRKDRTDTVDTMNGARPELVQARLVATDSLRTGEAVYMEHPTIDRCDGWIVGIAYGSGKSRNDEQIQIPGSLGMWIWTGQESSHIMADCIPGAPVLNEDGQVVGYFEYAGVGLFEDFCYVSRDACK